MPKYPLRCAERLPTACLCTFDEALHVPLTTIDALQGDTTRLHVYGSLASTRQKQL